jgi:hypothetical protein
MPAKFKPGDVVSIPGQSGVWTIANWPEGNSGNFSYYRDIEGVRTWGVGLANKTEKGEPVAENVAPCFVREGEVKDEQTLLEIADE